ncbi:PD-(D/E)XK motif protein [Bacillus safensis]|uniref:PD-(D/E)XK motif protein n=1 Tax=Bacillus safensis TaxID=561879 RepID=UPI0020761455|nr:PD-(D/E)XK motif protein [Bacillus safensis]USD83412.1 PD-(D/E)XK motif protein [Bacillus safensis]
MLNISNSFNALEERALGEENKDLYQLEPIYFQKPYLLIGLDLLNNQKRLYIDITNESWNANQLKAFPQWRGIHINQEYFAKIGPLKEKNFLVISQEVNKSDDIFENVLQNIVDHILVDEDLPLYTSLYEVLDRWHNFFKKNWEAKLSEEEEAGLFGELYYINKWLEYFPSAPPLIINDWKGPLRFRIDFVRKKSGIEIKTLSPKLRDEVKISSEKQLELNPVINELFLYVLKIEKNDAVGSTLENIAKSIDEKLIKKAPSLAVKFRETLLLKNIKVEEYNSNCFFIHEELAYEVREKFPRIESKQLPKGISRISYSLDLSHCEEFIVAVEDVFKLDKRK